MYVFIYLKIKIINGTILKFLIKDVFIYLKIYLKINRMITANI